MSDSEVLPAAVLTLLGPIPYLSTACQVAQELEACTDPTLPHVVVEVGLPDLAALVTAHHVRCRQTNKFTGAACRCVCHQPPARVVVGFSEDWTEEQRASWWAEFRKRGQTAERRREKAARQLPLVRGLTAGLLALRTRRRR